MEIVDKIAKLLSLGNGTSFEGEADTALQKAYKLMHEHNITMADINSSNKDNVLGYMGENSIVRYPSKQWELILVHNIATLFDCTTITTQKYIGNNHRQKILIIVGREGNRTTTELMYKWIRSKVEHDSLFKAKGTSGRNSYCLGVACTVARRIMEIKKSAPQTDEWGLVPASEVDEWLRKYYPNLIKSRASVNIKDGEAYRKGQSDGKDIGLNRQFAQHALLDAS